jgi:Beta-propeller repeat/Cep192 domain 4/Abnormal spindle-like microcephaly-assoc'd, ASPM-SPD-2-Hydin
MPGVCQPSTRGRGANMQRGVVSKVLLLLATATLSCSAQQVIQQVGSLQAKYGPLPLTFEANQGQADPQVKFVSRGPGYTVLLTTGGLVLSLRPVETQIDLQSSDLKGPSKLPPPAATLQLKLVGSARNPTVVGEDPQPGKVNYFIGNDPAKWRTNIPTFGRVRCKNIYPGIDLVYYGNHRQLEYDFEILPGADPSKIQFEVRGAQKIEVDGDGNLVLDTATSQLRFKSPVVYQNSNGQRTPVGGQYILRDSTHIAFQLSEYDGSKPLVIDPVLIYSTYLGGTGNDNPKGIAVDSNGNVYLAGYTDSADFPLATLGSLPAGSPHVFVAKLDATGSNLVYADYLGGNSQDYGYAIVLDGANDVYVTGSTASSDFPMVNPYQGTYPGAFNTFLSKISPDGSSLLYSTYLGGNAADIPASIGIDNVGEIVIGGYTSSTNFPVANAYQPTVSPNQGGFYGNYGFLTKFTPDGSSLVYSTYLGGNSNVALNCSGSPCWPQPFNTINGMVLDGTGNAYLAGVTNTYNFPTTTGAYLSTDTTQQDGDVSFVSKFNSSGSLQYSTYFYESSGRETYVTAIAADSSGAAYVTGSAISDGTFPLTSTNICDPSISGWACSYGFVTKFDSTGSSLLYSTFLGPNNYASPDAILLDANNDAYVLAPTSSNSFVGVNPIESYAGGTDNLVVEIDPTGTSELWATYVGGSLDDVAVSFAFDPSGNLYVAGSTDSIDFPTTVGAFQQISGGNVDAFVLKLGPGSTPSVSLSPISLQFPTQQVGTTSQPQQVLLRNMSSSSLTISSVSAVGDFSETDNCGTGVPAAGTCTISVTFVPTNSGQRTGSISIKDDATGSPHLVSLSGNATLGAAASVNPASVTFPSVAMGSSSKTQSVTLSSTGNATLNISGIQVVGDYSQINNCGASVPSGSTCTINLTFTPTATGTRSGSLVINDNAAGGSQIVALTGTGLDFSLSSVPNQDTVKSGSVATYVLTVSSVGGIFPNPVNLGCSGLPAHATCTLSVSSLTLTGNQANSTLTINTSSTSARLERTQQTRGAHLFALWLQLPGLGLLSLILPWRKKIGTWSRMLALIALLGLLALLPGCAGGTGIAPQGPQGTPPGTYTFTVTGTSGSLQHSLSLTLGVQ